MKQIKVYSGLIEELETEINAFLEGHPTIVVEQTSLHTRWVEGKGLYGTYVLVWRKGSAALAGDPIGVM